MTAPGEGPQRTAQDMADLVAAEATAGERVPVEKHNAAEREVDPDAGDSIPALLQESDQLETPER